MRAYDEEAREILAKAENVRRQNRRRNAAVGTALGLALLLAGGFAIRNALLPHNVGEGRIDLPGQTQTNAPTAPAIGTPTEAGTIDPEAPTEAGTAIPEVPTEEGPETVTNEPQTAATAPPETAPVGEIAIEKRWDEKSAPEKYPALRVNGREFTVQTRPLDAAFVGEVLFTATLTGQDLYTDEIHTLDAEARRIAGVDPNAGVAVTLEDGLTYAYLDPWFRTATLGDLIAALSLRESAAFGDGYATLHDGNGTVRRVYLDFDDALIWDALLPDPTTPNLAADGNWENWSPSLVGIGIDVPRLGIENHSLRLTEDGHLILNVPGAAAVWHVGPEKAAAFMRYLNENVPYTDERFEVPSGSGEAEPDGAPDVIEVWSKGVQPE